MKRARLLVQSLVSCLRKLVKVTDFHKVMKSTLKKLWAAKYIEGFMHPVDTNEFDDYVPLLSSMNEEKLTEEGLDNVCKDVCQYIAGDQSISSLLPLKQMDLTTVFDRVKEKCYEVDNNDEEKLKIIERSLSKRMMNDMSGKNLNENDVYENYFFYSKCLMQDYVKDVHYIWINSMVYNGCDSDYGQVAKNHLAAFNKHLLGALNHELMSRNCKDVRLKVNNLLSRLDPTEEEHTPVNDDRVVEEKSQDSSPIVVNSNVVKFADANEVITVEDDEEDEEDDVIVIASSCDNTDKVAEVRPSETSAESAFKSIFSKSSTSSTTSKDSNKKPSSTKKKTLKDSPPKKQKQKQTKKTSSSSSVPLASSSSFPAPTTAESATTKKLSSSSSVPLASSSSFPAPTTAESATQSTRVGGKDSETSDSSMCPNSFFMSKEEKKQLKALQNIEKFKAEQIRSREASAAFNLAKSSGVKGKKENVAGIFNKKVKDASTTRKKKSGAADSNNKLKMDLSVSDDRWVSRNRNLVSFNRMLPYFDMFVICRWLLISLIFSM
jgi:hypothetical protein